MKRQFEWFTLVEGAIVPTKAYASDACFDCYSSEDVVLFPYKPQFVNCGIGFNIDEDLEVVVRGRSSLARLGIWCHVGTVDADYVGPIGPILLNTGKDSFIIKKGDRVCQMAVRKVEDVVMVKAPSIRKTARGDKGFGSTGK